MFLDFFKGKGHLFFYFDMVDTTKNITNYTQNAVLIESKVVIELKRYAK